MPAPLTTERFVSNLPDCKIRLGGSYRTFSRSVPFPFCGTGKERDGVRRVVSRCVLMWNGVWYGSKTDADPYHFSGARHGKRPVPYPCRSLRNAIRDGRGVSTERSRSEKLGKTTNVPISVPGLRP